MAPRHSTFLHLPLSLSSLTTNDLHSILWLYHIDLNSHLLNTSWISLILWVNFKMMKLVHLFIKIVHRNDKINGTDDWRILSLHSWSPICITLRPHNPCVWWWMPKSVIKANVPHAQCTSSLYIVFSLTICEPNYFQVFYSCISGLEEAKIMYYACTLATIRLMECGLFVCSSTSPTLAVDLHVLELVKKLFVQWMPNMTAWCKALKSFLGAQGYKFQLKICFESCIWPAYICCT